MYEIMQKRFFLLHMASDVHQTVKNCPNCVRNHKRLKRERQLELFLESGTLKCIATDILGLLLQARNGNVFAIVVTNYYSKITRAIPTSKQTAKHVANVFLQHWIVPCDILDHFRASKSPQFVSNLVA